jgi:hypothetical protein
MDEPPASPGVITLRNGKQILRLFSSPDIRYNVPIKPSNTTYFGMTQVLRNIVSRLVKDGLNPNDYCVLSPHYLRFRYPDTGKWRGGDTQAGGGGKVATGELFCVGVREELIEELRIIGDSTHQYLESEIVSKRTEKSEPVTVVSKMYSFPASTCKIPDTYDASFYANPLRRGFDHYNEMVGFITWGTLDECMKLIQAIPVDKTEVLVDKIIGVAIISLPKAIEMADSAMHRLRGTIISERYPEYPTLSA